MVAASGAARPTVVIQASGGTTASIAEGRNWVEKRLQSLAGTPRVPIDLNELVVGVICGGSDATSG